MHCHHIRQTLKSTLKNRSQYLIGIKYFKIVASKKIFGGGDKKQKHKIENKGFLLFTPLIDLNAGKAVFVWYSLCSVRQCCKGCATPFRSSCPCTNVILQSLVPLHCKNNSAFLHTFRSSSRQFSVPYAENSVPPFTA